jgi:tryptophan synthase alpha chain
MADPRASRSASSSAPDAPRIMAHMVAFNPDREGCLAVARGLLEGGCAYLEIQFPFSDPTADGPDIQAACVKALEAGFTVDEGFRLVSQVGSFATVPVFVMSYANLVFTRGVKKFVAECKASGAAGIIVPDLPVDYDEGLLAAADAAGLANVPVVSPSTNDARLARIMARGPTFLYATLRLGTTGSIDGADVQGLAFLDRARSLPGAEGIKILGGFGVSTFDHVRKVQPLVHAVVVGSALVREIAKGGDPYGAALAKMRALTGRGDYPSS